MFSLRFETRISQDFTSAKHYTASFIVPYNIRLYTVNYLLIDWLFNDAVSTVEVIQCRIKWKHDHKW